MPPPSSQRRLRETFVAAVDRGITADFVVSPTGFNGLTTDIATQLSALPELSAVTGVRFLQAEVAAGDSAERPEGLRHHRCRSSFPQLVDLGMIEGDETDLDGGIFVNKDPAKDLGLHVGDTVHVTFKNGTSEQLPVTGIYRDAALAGNWLIGRSTVEMRERRAGRLPRRHARRRRGVQRRCQARTAIDSVLTKFPQAELKTAEEYKKDTAAQIDQLLVIITVLLAFAIVIAVLGISITLGLAVFERTREIGLMRAVGMTKRQTRKMVRWEAIIVSFFGAILGIVLGTLIGVALSLAGARQRDRRDLVQLVDDRDHPRRRRTRRLPRCALPERQGQPDERPRGDRHRVISRQPMGQNRTVPSRFDPSVSWDHAVCQVRSSANSWAAGCRSVGGRRPGGAGPAASGSRGTSRAVG